MPVSTTSTDSHSGPQNRARQGAPGNRCCGRNSRQNAWLSRRTANSTHGSSMLSSVKAWPSALLIDPARPAVKRSTLSVRVIQWKLAPLELGKDDMEERTAAAVLEPE